MTEGRHDPTWDAASLADSSVSVTGADLGIEELVAVARARASVAPLDAEVRAKAERSRAWVAEAVTRTDETIYGVNTGFGSLATTRIRPDRQRTLSRNVILKCMVGVGEPLPEDWVRAMILVRANSLACGVSGVRPVIIDTLIAMLEKGVVPVIPSKGSLGASGDLAPLAHLAAVATRGPTEMEEDASGEAWYEGARLSGEEAMAAAGIERPLVEAKEGLALTNGTTMMAAGAALALHDARRVLTHAEIAAALMMEGLRALSEAFHPDLHAANNQPGQVRTAARIRALLAGSRLIDSDPEKVQDAYSVRCTAQVLGPIHDMLGFLGERIEAALNAASDNPLIFPDRADHPTRKAISGGNFHGAGPALWLDTLGIAIAEAGNISDRRVFRALTPELSGGLPAMLIEEAGLHGGLMTVQYTGAALVSDNKTLAHPDSVDSIPSSANQEDHVSMGANAARHAREIVENVRRIVAIELVAAAQAVWLRPDGPARLGSGTAPVYEALREQIRPVTADRPLAPDIAAVERLIDSGALVRAAERGVGGPLP
ncbi:MAG: histidine ammonia-lyase [Gemmatimonadota bacterium]|nr:histidine ammonia-lyase [Gemmatimonadota bacterium]